MVACALGGQSGTVADMQAALHRQARVRRSLARDERGAAMTEYVVLLGAVGIGVAAAIAALGPSLVASYDRSRTILIGPMP